MSAATGMPRRRMLDPARAAGRLRATGIALPFAALPKPALRDLVAGLLRKRPDLDEDEDKPPAA